MLNSSIWLIDRTLSGATTSDQNGPQSTGNEGVLRISQSSRITEASPSDCSMSYSGYLLGESYSSAEMQSVYSAAQADWVTVRLSSLSKIDVSKNYWYSLELCR